MIASHPGQLFTCTVLPRTRRGAMIETVVLATLIALPFTAVIVIALFFMFDRFTAYLIIQIFLVFITAYVYCPFGSARVGASFTFLETYRCWYSHLGFVSPVHSLSQQQRWMAIGSVFAFAQIGFVVSDIIVTTIIASFFQLTAFIINFRKCKTSYRVLLSAISDATFILLAYPDNRYNLPPYVWRPDQTMAQRTRVAIVLMMPFLCAVATVVTATVFQSIIVSHGKIVSPILPAIMIPVLFAQSVFATLLFHVPAFDDLIQTRRPLS